MVNKKNSKKGEKTRLRPKERLIIHLIEHKEPQSIMAASEAIVMNYKNTYNLVNDLQPTIIHKEKIGNTNLIELNLVPDPDIYVVEKKRTERFLLRHPKLRVVKSYVEEVNYPFMIALIFGSYAKNKEMRNSDIDLCIISDNENKTKELHDKLNLLSLKLEIQYFTTKEFVSMIEKGQKNVGHEIVKSNIILYGIENYYNLISKWMKKE